MTFRQVTLRLPLPLHQRWKSIFPHHGDLNISFIAMLGVCLTNQDYLDQVLAATNKIRSDLYEARRSVRTTA